MEKFRRKFVFIGKIESFTHNNNKFNFKSTNGLVRITILSERIFRLQATNRDDFVSDYSWVVIKNKWDNVEISLNENEEYFEISTQYLKLKIERDPFRLTVFDTDDSIWKDAEFGSIGWDKETFVYIKKLPNDEHFFGFGEKTGALDKRGYYYIMKTRESAGYQDKTDPLYQSHPFFISVRHGKSYGIFLDNTWETFFDMGKKFNDHYFFGAKNGDLNLYFFYGPTMKEVITGYTELIGRILLPPIWSLGYFQSRWGYKNQEIVSRIAHELRSRKIPADSIVLDIDYMDGYRVFTWNNKRFPDKNFFKKYNEGDGFNFVTIVDPGIKIDKNYFMYNEGIKNDYFVKKKNGKYWKGYVWPGAVHFPDFTKEETREWWGKKLKILLDRAITGIWNDMNEPSFNIQPYAHRVKTKDLIFYDNGLNTPFEKNRNVYGLLMAKATHDGLLKLRPNKRPWILTRSGFAGIHRYAAVWTGDNTSNWKHLAMSIPMLLNMSISSIPQCGADIGGFNIWFTAFRKLFFKLNKILIIRWHQLGAFYPFSRNHTLKQSKPQEPWEFGEKAENIIKKYINLRYHWLPYFYNLFIECSKTGIPPMRPLILEFPDDEICYRIDYQFMWGSYILFAPIIKKHQKIHKIYLPEGVWIDYWSNKKFNGKQFIEIVPKIEDIPIFIKSNAIIPCQPQMLYFKEKQLNPLIIELYPNDKGESTFIFQEDDGESLNYLKNEFCTTKFTLKIYEKTISFNIDKRIGNYIPNKRDYLVIFKAIQKPQKVILNENEIKEDINSKSIDKLENNKWSFNEKSKEMLIKFEDSGDKQSIKLFL
ncbi:MAG: glycoside hydrolase family 31 protein [Candidatus Helarchaeota archaeon]